MLEEVLKDAGVKCAHIVDDAYDEQPAAPLTLAEAQSFADSLDIEQTRVIGTVLGLEDASADAFLAALQDLDKLRILFDRREEFAYSKKAFDGFLADRKGQLDKVQPLVELLEKAGVKCITFGADYAPDGVDEPNVVFIDLRLNEASGALTIVDDAVRAYKKLRVAQATCKPFVFLMSSIGRTLHAKREEFREGARLFASQFETVEKGLFKDEDATREVLSRYLRVLPLIAKFEDHFRAIEDAMKGASSGALETLRALDLADYFALDANTAKVEDVKLGTYIAEMLLEYLAHKLEASPDIWKFATTLDQIEMSNLPRSRFGLSYAAAELYSANMLHAKARLNAEAERASGPVQGYFYLGDIFFPAQALNGEVKTALVVVTPACDLARPELLRKRSMLLCEGVVRKAGPAAIPTGTDSLPLVVMPHPTIAKQQLLIEWKRKKLHVWGAAEIDKFKSDETCTHVLVGRLRPVYALQLQHAIAADLSRIGTQRPPNMLVPHGLECFYVEGDIWTEIDLHASQDPTAAALTDSTRDKDARWTFYVLADSYVQAARTKALDSVSKAQDKNSVAGLEKILKSSDFVQKLIYIDHKVPEKTAGAAQDVTAYPYLLSKGLNEAERKSVAVVRPMQPSAYKDVAAGQQVRAETQPARLIFRLREIAIDDGPKQSEGAE